MRGIRRVGETGMVYTYVASVRLLMSLLPCRVFFATCYLQLLVFLDLTCHTSRLLECLLAAA